MRALVMNCSPVRNGATAEIVRIVSEQLREKYEVRTVCIDDYEFQFCKGCRVCHNTAKCVQSDDVDKIMEMYEWADMIVSVAPSYWADIPGQFKAFIDRCTPWCNTHEPHRTISSGKKGYVIALRTGFSMGECNRIIESIEHFYGHLEIEASGSMGLTNIECREAVEPRKMQITEFVKKSMMSEMSQESENSGKTVTGKLDRKSRMEELKRENLQKKMCDIWKEHGINIELSNFVELTRSDKIRNRMINKMDFMDSNNQSEIVALEENEALSSYISHIHTELTEAETYFVFTEKSGETGAVELTGKEIVAHTEFIMEQSGWPEKKNGIFICDEKLEHGYCMWEGEYDIRIYLW